MNKSRYLAANKYIDKKHHEQFFMNKYYLELSENTSISNDIKKRLLNTPFKTIERHIEVWVCDNIATHPNLNMEIQGLLFDILDSIGIELLLKNSCLFPEIRERIINETK